MFIDISQAQHYVTAIASAAPGERAWPARRSEHKKRVTAMTTSTTSSIGVRFALAIFLSAVIAGGYLTAIGYLNPGFIA